MKRLLLVIMILFATPSFAAEVTLQWDAVDNATGYRIYSSTDNGESWGSAIEVGNKTTFTVMDVPDNGRVLFAVSAFNANGESIRYDAGVFYCKDCTPPSAPSGIGVE